MPDGFFSSLDYFVPELNRHMRIIQISDSHLARDKPVRADELEAAVDYINGLAPTVDAVVHTGDVVEKRCIGDYEIAKNLLDRLSAPYFVIPGNHDDRVAMTEMFGDRQYFRADRPFIQYVVDLSELRLIMIDTTSSADGKGHLCTRRMDHLKDMLEADTSRPVMLFMHHPPFEVMVGPHRWHFQDQAVAKALIAELRRHDHIVHLGCGHVHRAYDTELGRIKANVVSSLATDVRWDEPEASALGQPVHVFYHMSMGAEVVPGIAVSET